MPRRIWPFIILPGSSAPAGLIEATSKTKGGLATVWPSAATANSSPVITQCFHMLLIVAQVDVIQIGGDFKRVLAQRRLHRLPFGGGPDRLPMVLCSHLHRHCERGLVHFPAIGDGIRV